MASKRKPSAGSVIDARREKARNYAHTKRLTNEDYAKAERAKSRLSSRQKSCEKYGLTQADVDATMQRQNYSCAICENPFVDSEGPQRIGKVHIDHDHLSNKFRGFLCHGCNMMLGASRDCPTTLQKAMSYLYSNGADKPKQGWGGVLIGKVWGATITYLDTPLLSMHRISVKPNMQCSLHAHERKWNCFIVLDGKLTIERHKREYALIDKTELGPWDVCTVPPMENHRFVTGAEGAEAFEIYYLDPLAEDIVRKTCGGPMDMPS